ncbi:MAG: M1 family metallopeptidase [Woeseiaceae bacterium]|nr:M1 family metallopeptidase [Woeseiaceae bacterium]
MKYLINGLLAVMAAAVLGCAEPEPPAAETATADIFSFANTTQFVTRHLHLDLDVDFEAQVLRGSATLQLERVDGDASRIVLDTRDLDIAAAGFLVNGGKRVATAHTLGDRDDTLGAPLTIEVPSELADHKLLSLRIDYNTSPESTALMWLPARLTAGGEHPLMFSQSQSIHARSWVPLQDTPAVRITYSATIRTPQELVAVMSADNDPAAARDGEFTFEMPQPIPSYLLAMAVGNLGFAELGDRTGVYAEPELLEASAWEFADTQAMLEKAETMFGPYQWGRYDILILPPSFPYGGMENPRLSFLTPSLIAGDRSLVAVVAHELAHSWSGNLVTNATWRDIWLNEGWTSYLEYRLMQEIFSVERAEEENVINYEELLDNFERIDPKYHGLAPRVDLDDPDYAQGTIPYHKGNLFLQYLEHAFGRGTFDAFITKYFDAHAFEVITSEQFLDYLDAELLSAYPGKVSRATVEEWFYQGGLPEAAVIPRAITLEEARELAVLWSRGEIGTDRIPIDAWSPHATIHFIDNLDADLSPDKLAELDAALRLSDTQNAEIARTWFTQVAKRRYRPAYEQLGSYLKRYGRARLIVPIYAALTNNGEDAGLAKELFAAARENYHPQTVGFIESTLESSD